MKIKLHDYDIDAGVIYLIKKLERTKNENEIFIDCSNIKMLHSGYLGVLIRFYKDLKLENKKLIIVNANEDFRNFSELCGLSKIMPIYSTEEEYLQTQV